MRRVRGVAAAAVLALAAGAGLAAVKPMPDGDWRTINRDLAGTRFSPLNQINRGNVSSLAVAWSYPMKGYNTAVPLVIDGTMYFPAGNRVVALDAATGKELWVHEETIGAGERGVSGRGVGYWPGDARTPARIMFMVGNKMVALDARSGQPVAGFGQNGTVDVGVGFGGTPTIFGDVAEIGAATNEDPVGVPGNPRGFDVRTGKKLWEFHSVPLPGELGHESWMDGWKGRSGTNQWGFAAPVDEKTGLIYIPLGSPSPNYYRGDAPGANLFGNSVVALDMKTGKYRWHFQTVHHDLWDTDQPTAGPLVDLKVGGQTRTGLVAVNKSSLFFELDRATGKPLFPVEERAVPKGDVPGEYYSPTEPFPTQTPPLSRVSFDPAKDLVTEADTTPEHVAACKAMMTKAGGYYNVGQYTPFLYHAEGAPPRSTIQLPGGIGGVNWGGAAVDPTTGWVYVNAHDTSLVGWVEKVPAGSKSYSFDASVPPAYERASVDGKGPFFSFAAPVSGKYDDKGKAVGPTVPCYKGPWARLTAVDANTGQVKFAVPLGLVEGLPEGKQLQGDTGSAGPTVTAGGLVFVGATNDKRFRAFDSTSGRQLWEAKLSNSANANPMSYRARSGKQYVAINAGGSIVAYTLP